MKKFDNVRIRMYKQGLGDCFLVSFMEKKSSQFNIMIDFGVLLGTEDAQKEMGKVAQDIKDTANNEIDILVVTHEHWDHISGFSQAKDIVDKLKIKQIWMSWIEDSNNELARQILEKQNKKLETIKLAYDNLSKINNTNLKPSQKQGFNNYLRAYSSFFSIYGLNEFGIAAAPSTHEIFEGLKNRQNTRTLYLEPGKKAIEPEEIEGVRIYILGPPTSEKDLKRMNPSKNQSEVYTDFAASSSGDNLSVALINFGHELEEDPYKPFSSNQGIPLNEANLRNIYPNYYDPANEWQKIEYDWLFSAGNLAIQVDNGINNTSLVIAIELVKSQKVLLFAADAQVGNWLSWFDYEWEINSGVGKEKVTVDDLLKKVVVYKCGHHGSHNATMKAQGLEKMTDTELIALIPVSQKMATKKGWKMPFKPLLEALNKQTNNKVIVADEPYPQNIKFDGKPDKEYQTDLYYDVYLKN